METNEIKKLENLKKLIFPYFSTLKSVNDKKGAYTAKIELSNHYELGCVITNMLKMCVLALDQDAHKISETGKDTSINVGLVLEVVLQMFPMDEFELLSEIGEQVY